jgi:hypothetical protein
MDEIAVYARRNADSILRILACYRVRSSRTSE